MSSISASERRQYDDRIRETREEYEARARSRRGKT